MSISNLFATFVLNIQISAAYFYNIHTRNNCRFTESLAAGTTPEFSLTVSLAISLTYLPITLNHNILASYYQPKRQCHFGIES